MQGSVWDLEVIVTPDLGEERDYSVVTEQTLDSLVLREEGWVVFDCVRVKRISVPKQHVEGVGNLVISEGA